MSFELFSALTLARVVNDRRYKCFCQTVLDKVRVVGEVDNCQWK